MFSSCTELAHKAALQANANRGQHPASVGFHSPAPWRSHSWVGTGHQLNQLNDYHWLTLIIYYIISTNIYYVDLCCYVCLRLWATWLRTSCRSGLFLQSAPIIGCPSAPHIWPSSPGAALLIMLWGSRISVRYRGMDSLFSLQLSSSQGPASLCCNFVTSLRYEWDPKHPKPLRLANLGLSMNGVACLWMRRRWMADDQSPAQRPQGPVVGWPTRCRTCPAWESCSLKRCMCRANSLSFLTQLPWPAALPAFDCLKLSKTCKTLLVGCICTAALLVSHLAEDFGAHKLLTNSWKQKPRVSKDRVQQSF